MFRPTYPDAPVTTIFKESSVVNMSAKETLTSNDEVQKTSLRSWDDTSMNTEVVPSFRTV